MWKWNSRARRYYNDETGQFMPRAKVLGYVQQSIDAGGLVTDTLGNLVMEARLSPLDWRHMMREEIKREYIAQYLLGIGGRDQMTFEDWGRLGGMLKEQYGHLDKFYDQIVAGKLSDAQVGARSRMYSASAREAFERANGQAWGDPPLPAYPGDGKVCAGLTNCACNWEIVSVKVVKEETQWTCYWRLGFVKTEHCEACENAAFEWNPLIAVA